VTTQKVQLDQPGNSIELGHRGASAFFIVRPLRSASFAGIYPACASNPDIASVSNLSSRQPISTQHFVKGGYLPQFGIMVSDSRLSCGGGNRGQFHEAGTAFIGFKFRNQAGVYYGWARIQMRTTYGNAEFKLMDYAYGDVGDRIKAGQKSGHDKPELESLGGLALGALGLLAWRKSRVPAAH